MIALAERSDMAGYQRYIQQLEEFHGWLDVDLVHNCFLMGEEVGELFKAIRRYQEYYDEKGAPSAPDREGRCQAVAEELVDVFNYLLALANRLDIDLEQAFRAKNARNQQRVWKSPS
jgi:NTP pyrophosphatase (non-canonical NTP hydrolase)